MSNIEWTDLTWNPIVGCSIVSPGCANCYAMKMAARLESMAISDTVIGDSPLRHYLGTTKKVNTNWVWTGEVREAPEETWEQPLKRRKPTMWFVNSMGDLFHESIPRGWIDRAFDVMERAPQHTFQILTKRARRMHYYMQGRKPLPNVWLGVSVERQFEADDRIPYLIGAPAAVRFLSCEPLLGAVILSKWLVDLHWVIVGGESGPNSRPMRPDWAQRLRGECVDAGVPFFFKQWGAWFPHPGGNVQGYDYWIDRNGKRIRKGREETAVMMRRAGDKAKAGRELDGRTWDEMPLVRQRQMEGSLL